MDNTVQKPALQKPTPTELARAVKLNRIKEVENLLQRGADFNEEDPAWERDVLGIAIALGRTEIARLLIGKGADIGKKYKGGITPLMIAAYSGRTEIAHMLASSGADTEATSNSGWTALMYSVIGKEIAIMRALLDKGADISVRNRAGQTVQDLAEIHNRPEMIQLLKDMPSRRFHEVAVKRQRELKLRAPKVVIIRGPLP
jgi:ankyrin repeat protein